MDVLITGEARAVKRMGQRNGRVPENQGLLPRAKTALEFWGLSLRA